MVQAEDVGGRGAVAEQTEKDEEIAPAAQDHDFGQQEQPVLMQGGGGHGQAGPQHQGGHGCAQGVLPAPERGAAGAVGGQGLPDDPEGDGGKVPGREKAPGQAVDALVDHQQADDGQEQQEKLRAGEKAAPRGDERGIDPCGQGQEREHDQEGKGVGLEDADDEILLEVAGAGHLSAEGLEGGLALLLGGGELAFTVGHGKEPPCRKMGEMGGGALGLL